MFNDMAGTDEAPTADEDSWSVDQTLECLATNKNVSLQYVFKKTGTYTIQFQLYTIDPQPNIALPKAIYAEATVSWAVKGATVSRTISLINGMSISGVGEAVQVVIRDLTTDISMGGVKYGVIATIAAGQRSGLIPPHYADPLKRNLIVIAAGASSTWDVPLTAGANSFQVSVASSDGSVISDQKVQAIQSSQVAALRHRVCDPRQFNWIPLEAGATQVTILNSLAVPLWVTLTWGIDG